jgi:hypothetical protein
MEMARTVGFEPATFLEVALPIITICRSERKAGENQQVVPNADQLLAPSLSALIGLLVTSCQNYVLKTFF